MANILLIEDEEYVRFALRRVLEEVGHTVFEAVMESGHDVTDDFVRYAKPLVGEGMVSLPMLDGRQRLTRFEPIYASQTLEKYVPEADRMND